MTAAVQSGQTAMPAARRPRPRGWRVLGALLGIVLLAAAAMKGYALATRPLADAGWLSSRPLLIALVEGELLLGLWLLSGLATRTAWSCALLCFAAFTCVSGHEAISGAASCGCFGSVHVNPWHTFAFDLAAIVALVVFKPDLHRRVPVCFARFRLAAIGLVALLAGGIGGYAMASYKSIIMTGQGGFSDGGDVVLLEPEQWVGKPFPLAGQIDIGKQLMQGHWLVVFYRHDCPICREEVPKYEKRAYRNHKGHEGPNIALVELPPYAPMGEGLVSSSSPAAQGKLSDAKQWFVTAPAVVELRSGMVIEAR